MRNYMLTGLLVLFTVATYAQHVLTQRQSLINEFAETVKGEKDAASRTAAFSYFINAGSGQYRGTDAMAQRLIGYRENNYTGSALTGIDSITWTYGADRGSTATTNELYNERKRWVLNSGNIVPDTRRTRSWNMAGQNTEFILEEWAGNAYTNEMRTQYAYDANGNRTHVTSQSWTGTAWKFAQRSIFTFVNNRPVIEEQSIWQDTVWVPTYYNSYAYDAIGYVKEQLYQQVYQDSLHNMFHFIYTNDANGNRLTELERHWISGAWQNFRRGTYTYAQNKPTSEIYEVWFSNAWHNDTKLEYTYNGNGLMLTEFTFDGEPNGWDGTIQKYFVYNGTQLVEDSTLRFNVGMWRRDVRTTYTYDANGNADILTFYDAVGGNWVTDARFNYNFNTVYNNLDSLLVEEWSNGNWQTDYQRFYYYEEYNAPSGIGNVEDNFKVAVYPNPTTTILNIDFTATQTGEAQVRVYNVNGQQVQAGELNVAIGDNYLPLNIAGLSSGLYMVELQTAAGVKRVKFYKQ